MWASIYADPQGVDGRGKGAGGKLDRGGSNVLQDDRLLLIFRLIDALSAENELPHDTVGRALLVRDIMKHGCRSFHHQHPEHQLKRWPVSAGQRRRNLLLYRHPNHFNTGRPPLTGVLVERLRTTKDSSPFACSIFGGRLLRRCSLSIARSSCSSETSNLSAATRDTTTTCFNFRRTAKSASCSVQRNTPRASLTTIRSVERIFRGATSSQKA